MINALLALVIPLNGAWEMAYSPYFLEVNDYPTFSGKLIENAVPGYWEDMTEQFRAAGIAENLRINPEYTERSLPARGWAPDTQLPQPYGLFFYRRQVEIPAVRDGYLAFEGVRNDVRVWVNGKFVELREGYSTPFEIDIPASFFRPGSNEITLAVQNRLNHGYNGDYVYGLTSRALFRATGGISGKVELVFPEDGVRDFYVTTAADLKSFTLHVAAGKCDYEILDGEKMMASGTAEGEVKLATAGYEFWSPENPKRYLLKLKTAAGEHRQYFGLRRLTARGTKLLLNGQPAMLRGVTEHGYFPLTVHLPRDLEYYRMITRKRKELGFNFVRFHTFVPPVEYLEATDELGMLVHIESPNFVPEWEFASIIKFARRHPSVVVYCTGNETRIDRLAEAYLTRIAEMVHGETDALFSPMSALRGVSYQLFKGLDPIVDRPFRHNHERAGRLSKYCDLFNDISNNATSYDYIDGPDSRAVDRWASAYFMKPRLLHETCIDGTYADLSLEAMYPETNPIRRTKLFSEVRRVLTEKGIVGNWGIYFTNSCKWVAAARKVSFERLRACETIAGFDFLGDINTHWHTYGYSVGMMDEFYRLKPCETRENVLRYNSPAVLLADFGTDFVTKAGEDRVTTITLSNYAADAGRGELTLELVRAPDAAVVYAVTQQVSSVRLGRVAELKKFKIHFPEGAAKYLLKAHYSADKVLAENEWTVYAFPQPPEKLAQNAQEYVEFSDVSRDDLLAALAAGKRVLLLGTGPFKTSPMTYNTGRAGRCSGNFATVIREGHPALEGFPHDGWCGWQFRRLMGKAKVAQLEKGVPFNPIIDVASAVKCPIKQAAMFEYQVGEGRLLVATFAFGENDPAAMYLKRLLENYVASERFAPKDVITVAQLAEVIDAPLTVTTADPNRAANPGDPAGQVRIRAHAQP